MRKIRSLIFLCAALFCLMLVSCSNTDKVQADGEIGGLLIKFNEKGDACTVVGTNGQVKDIVIPEKCSGIPVTRIAEYAFKDHSEITSVTLNSNIKSIGTCAFQNCTSLESIVIPVSVTSIEHSAFSGCTGLESVEIERTNETVSKGENCKFGEFVFKDCTSLKTVTIGSGIKEIGGRMFYNCTSLENVALPDKLTKINQYAFANCTGLKEITIPDSVSTLGENVFKNCDALEKVTVPFIGASKYGTGSVKLEYLFGEGSAFSSIPKSLKSVTVTGAVKIGDGALEDCSEITEIVLSDKIVSIGDGAFIGTGYYNNSNNWKDGVLYIGNHLIAADNVSGEFNVKEGTVCIAGGAFRGCNGLKDVTLPDGVMSIGPSAFENCTGIKTVTVPDSVTSVGNSAFAGCSGLSDITLGSGAKTVGNNVFGGCSTLTKIVCKLSAQPKTWDEAWKGDCTAEVEWNAKNN